MEHKIVAAKTVDSMATIQYLTPYTGVALAQRFFFLISVALARCWPYYSSLFSILSLPSIKYLIICHYQVFLTSIVFVGRFDFCFLPLCNPKSIFCLPNKTLVIF